MTTYRKLTRGRTSRIIGGVCSGFAEYFQVDVTLVRLAFVFVALLGGLGVLLYLIALVIVPSADMLADNAPVAPERNGAKIAGIILIAVGAMFFLKNVGIELWNPFWDFPWGFGFPVLLIGIGLWIIYGRRSTGLHPAADPSVAGAPGEEGTPRLTRSRSDSKLFGVCGGVGAYLNTDPTIVRVLFVAGAFMSAGLMVLLYIIMALVVPLEVAHAPQG
jgi:phage shock protein PspC (stress-responsive transcriptional regulator)